MDGGSVKKLDTLLAMNPLTQPQTKPVLHITVVQYQHRMGATMRLCCITGGSVGYTAGPSFWSLVVCFVAGRGHIDGVSEPGRLREPRDPAGIPGG